MSADVKFTGGRNIAMKVPPHQYEATVKFYRDVARLKQLEGFGDAVGFQFGSNHLWIDRVPGISQAEIWLELATDNTANAAERLAAAGVVRCDEIETLPEKLDAFWISGPSQIIHLVCKESDSW
jgi:hypothetical protein